MARSWTKTCLGSVATWSSGGTPAKSRGDYWVGDIPWVSPKDMKRFSLDDAEDHISERAVGDGAHMVPPGTIFLVVRGMILAHTFPVCIAQRSMSFNQDVKALIPQPGVEGRFLAHWLHGNRNKLLALVTEATHGTKRIDLRDLQAAEILLPPPREQRRVAEILDTLDEAIRKTEQLIAKLKQVKQGLLHDLLTRGIDDNGELRDPARHPEQFRETPLGRIPKTWRFGLLDEFAEVRSGIAKNEGRVVQEPVEVQYLRVANVQDGYLDLDDMKTIRVARADLARYRVLPGDVLMNEGGDLDKLGRGTLWRGEHEFCVHQNHVFVVRCGTNLRPEFLTCWTAAARAKNYFMMAGKQTTNLASINKTQLGRLPVPLPSIAEQDRMLEVLDACERRIGVEGLEADKLRMLKAGLTNDLLTGRVPVINLVGEAAA